MAAAPAIHLAKNSEQIASKLLQDILSAEGSSVASRLVCRVSFCLRRIRLEAARKNIKHLLVARFQGRGFGLAIDRLAKARAPSP